jgi:Protein of unknown function (DUF3631)
VNAELVSDLLDAVELFLRRFVVLTDAQAAAAALWVAHSWAIAAAHATAYLHVTSAEPECGKTRLLEVAHELVRAPLSTMNISDAALFRAIDARRPTLFLDEVDAIFSKKAQERGAKDDLRALLNAGYRRGQVVYRMGGGNHTTLESFEVFSAKALAGLGSLPPTLASRCLRIELKRRRADEPVDDFFPQEVAEDAARLRDRLETWAETAHDELAPARPARIDGLRDRTNEVWRPLLAIAELAGETWAARARRAALSLAGANDDEASLGVLLLEDVRAVFDERQAERIATADLVRALADFDESPWGEWWLDKDNEPLRSAPRRLAQLLRPFGVRSKDVRTNGSKKGYKREDFADAWERFLAPSRTRATSATSATTGSHKQRDVADVADVADRRGGPAEVPSGVGEDEIERVAEVMCTEDWLSDDEITELGLLSLGELEERYGGDGDERAHCPNCGGAKKVDKVRAGLTYLACGHMAPPDGEDER